MIAVVDHECGHAAIDDQVLPVDEAVFIGAEEEHSPNDIHGMADALHGVLETISF